MTTTTTFDLRAFAVWWGERIQELAEETAKQNAAEVNGHAGTGAMDAASHSAPVVSRPSAAPSGCQYEGLIRSIWTQDADFAIKVAMRESRCTAGAVNNEGCDRSGRTASHALGVFQMCYPLHQASFDAAGCNAPLDAECGIKAAWQLYLAAGRGPWGG